VQHKQQCAHSAQRAHERHVRLGGVLLGQQDVSQGPQHMAAAKHDSLAQVFHLQGTEKFIMMY
jgi:hypothetical protein